MGILSELNQLLTWWNGQTFGTRVFTARKGQRVGEDEQGNQYYQELMADLRDAIGAGKLAEFTAAFAARREEGDLEPV